MERVGRQHLNALFMFGFDFASNFVIRGGRTYTFIFHCPRDNVFVLGGISKGQEILGEFTSAPTSTVITVLTLLVFKGRKFEVPREHDLGTLEFRFKLLFFCDLIF